MEIQRLQDLNVEAWTYLLRQEREMMDVVVEQVMAEPLTLATTRYTLTLQGHTEPVTLIGKRGTAAEVHFYKNLAPYLPLVPYCWFSDLFVAEGWLVLDDAGPYHPSHTWRLPDVEGLLEQLAVLHGHFWGNGEKLHLLPNHLGQANDFTNAFPNRSSWQNALHTPLNHAFAWPQTNSQTQGLNRVTIGLQILQGLGDWPGVFNAEHLQICAHLLERPHRLLEPLREMPFTLIHGRPAVENWRIDLFDQGTLLDWQTVSYGPAVCDLIHFIEDFYITCTSPDPSQKRAHYMYSEWPLVEETLIDTYFIRLASELTPNHYDARQMRRYGLPAARCLYMLTHWLPALSEWVITLPNRHLSWKMIQAMGDKALDIGYTPFVGLHAHLHHVFERFLNSYKLL